MIRFDDVGFSYDNKELLRHVNSHMDDGQFVGILGPNGGGKSTFLKLTLGMLKPQTGKITITDTRIGYLSQTTSVQERNLQCSVWELVCLGLVQGRKLFLSKKDKAKARAALEEFGLWEIRHHLLSELSGGQLQRARLAKTLVVDPTLLVFDEPDAGMDEENHHHLIHVIEDLHRQGKSILFVSHHPHDLESADAIYFIEDGELITYEEETQRGHHHVSL